jgi:ABC-type Zn2+ transport system substrate-binding protein/surface adhesin
MRAILVLGTLATLVALGGSLPPKDKDKDKDEDNDYDHKHENGHGNDYGSDHDHADSNSDSKSGFHIADCTPTYKFNPCCTPPPSNQIHPY